MSLANLDPELRPALESYLSARVSFDPDDLQLLRQGMSALFEAAPPARPTSVLVEDVTAPGPGGDPEVGCASTGRPRRHRCPPCTGCTGAAMMIGSIAMDDALLAGMVERLGMAAVSVEYRLAPEHPDPAPVEDCYAGLVWTAAHAVEHGIDPDRIAVGGASAGGGLAAGIALFGPRPRRAPRRVPAPPRADAR